jgi:predicted small lipoprotein YifL
MLRRHPILISRISLAVLFGCAALSAACGQQGPLYRPDEKAQQVTPEADNPSDRPSDQSSDQPGDSSQSGKKKSVPTLPAPQSQKEDRAPENPPPADTTTGTPAPVQPVDPDRPATVPPGQSSGQSSVER